MNTSKKKSMFLYILSFFFSLTLGLGGVLLFFCLGLGERISLRVTKSNKF